MEQSVEVFVLALDPGRTTGYAFGWKTEDSFLIAYSQAEMDHGQLWRFIPALIDVVICESFEFRQGKQIGVDLYPCELIGVVKLWVEGPTFRDSDTVALYMQPASVQGKKGYWSDEHLKKLGLYQKGLEHGRSAVKHLLQWFYFGSGFQYMNADQPKLVTLDEFWKLRGVI